MHGGRPHLALLPAVSSEESGSQAVSLQRGPCQPLPAVPGRDSGGTRPLPAAGKEPGVKEMKQTRREIRFCVQTEVPYKNTAIGKDMWLGGRSTRFISESGPLVPSLVIPAAPSPSPRRAETGSSGAAMPRGWAGSQRGARATPGPERGRAAGNSAFPLQVLELCRRPVSRRPGKLSI